MCKLRLFVAGKTPRSEQIVKAIMKLIEDEFKGQYSLEVIDVIEHPESAERDKVFATPTLMKIQPPPVRRLIGDLSSRGMLLASLQLVKHGSDGTMHRT